jgi:NADH:ubiquinone oxidoreductase subunit 3 (subunit A)
MGSSSMIVLILAALAFSSIAILIAKIVTKSTTNPQKGEPYECGIPTTGKTWKQLNVGYYLFALIFLIFVVEGCGGQTCRVDGVCRNFNFLFYIIYGIFIRT